MGHSEGSISLDPCPSSTEESRTCDLAPTAARSTATMGMNINRSECLSKESVTRNADDSREVKNGPARS